MIYKKERYKNNCWAIYFHVRAFGFRRGDVLMSAGSASQNLKCSLGRDLTWTQFGQHTVGSSQATH